MTAHQPTRLTATGIARPLDPAAMLDLVCEHFVEHGTVTRGPDFGRIENPIGNAEFRIEGAALAIRIDCPDAASLFTVKTVIAEHLFMFSGDAPMELDWHDAGQPAEIPFFRQATVLSAANVTPRMRRVTLSVPDAERLGHGGLHVRPLLPPKGRNPVWPTARPDGRIRWPDGEDALVVRVYTIRALDLDASTIDIDFVLHEGDHTPAATWSKTVEPGAVIGLMGPGGGGLPDARRLFIAGDETALPAIIRMAEAMAPGTVATIVIELDNPDERQPLSSQADIDLTWVYRHGRPAGTAGLLPQAVRAARLDLDDGQFHVWVACEHAEARDIRRYLRQERKHDRTRHMVAAYWRRGHSGEDEADDA